MAAGRSANEPCAIVATAARANQQVIITTLDKLGAQAETSEPLCIIVVGQNVTLAKELSWLAC